jgi:hypothetical protein
MELLANAILGATAFTLMVGLPFQPHTQLAELLN